MRKPGVLMLCVANSARSQMAEALAKARYGDAVVVMSAGSEPSRVHPMAIAAMESRGLAMGDHSSKHVDEIDPATVDVVLTLCAEEYCPTYLHGAKRLHWPMPDPAGNGSTLEGFLRVAEQIEIRLSELDPLLRPPPR